MLLFLFLNYLLIVAYVADVAAVNSNDIKSLLANVLSTFLIKGKPVFSNGPKSLPNNYPDSPILRNWVFVYFILAEEPFAKALRSLKTFLLVNNNLCRKLFSSLESLTTVDKIFFKTFSLKVTSVIFCIPYFNLRLKYYNESFYTDIILNQNKLWNTQ